jgi:hypothetical protein
VEPPTADIEGGNVTRKTCAPGLIVLLFAIWLISIAAAQTGWLRVYGGPGDDVGYSVRQTTDGGYIVAGYTFSFGVDGDFYLLKTNASGETLWTRTYGGSSTDYCYSVEQTADGGYILGGGTGSFGAGNFDVYLVKTNASGDTLWTRTYGGPSMDEGYSVQQTTDGGYIVVGATDNYGVTYDHVFVVKTNALGDTLWTRIYGGASNASAGYSVQQTKDGGYIIAGDLSSAGVYLIKTDAQGDTLWTRTYGGTYGDVGYSVQQTVDDGYVIAGVDDTAGGSGDAYLIKTNSQGDTLWTRTYGGLSAAGFSVQQTADGGYIVAGYNCPDSTTYGGVYLVKTDALGDTLWTRTYGVMSASWGNSVRQTTDGGYVVTGTTNGPEIRDFYLIKTDSLGNVGVVEPPTRQPVRPTRFLVQPSPFTSFARVPGHEAELFAISDVSGRQVAVCKGDRVGEGLRPGMYFLSPVDLKTRGPATATVIKAAF